MSIGIILERFADVGHEEVILKLDRNTCQLDRVSTRLLKGSIQNYFII